MAALVIAEHDNHAIRGGTLNAVTAALKCSADVTVLVAGGGCAAAGASSGGGSKAEISSPPRTGREARAAVPLTATSPAASAFCHRARLTSGQVSASQRSRRGAAAAAVLVRAVVSTGQTLEGFALPRKVCRCARFRASLAPWKSSRDPR